MDLSSKAAATPPKGPSKLLLTRIDIGLTTAVCAVFISLLALVVAQKEIDLAVKVHKASVLPIIDIDFGYVGKTDESGQKKQYFDVVLSNAGVGVAHIQKVSISQKGKAITGYQEFEDTIMTRRMRGWSRLTEKSAAGFLPAGENVVPVSYKLGAGESDLPAYLRGEWGTPMDQVNVEVCYCSVSFNDCWSVNYLDRKIPKPVQNCGIDDEVDDVFQTFIDQKVKKRQEK